MLTVIIERCVLTLVILWILYHLRLHWVSCLFSPCELEGALRKALLLHFPLCALSRTLWSPLVCLCMEGLLL